jgi:hypothetical protein
VGSRPDEVNDFINLPSLSGHTRPWGLLSLLTEISTRRRKIMFLGIRARPVRKSGNLVSRLSRQCGIPNISQPYRPPRPVTGIAILYLFYFIFHSDGNIAADNLKPVSPPCHWVANLTVQRPYRLCYPTVIA